MLRSHFHDDDERGERRLGDADEVAAHAEYCKGHGEIYTEAMAASNPARSITSGCEQARPVFAQIGKKRRPRARRRLVPGQVSVT